MDGLNLNRRGFLGLGAATGLGLWLTGCSNAPAPIPTAAGGSASGGGIDVSAYDAIIKSGPVADAAVLSANAWATRIKGNGVLQRGGTESGAIFSLKDPMTGRVTGFDAGIGDLLAHYILGGDDVSKLVALQQTSVDTRETMLQNNTVDVVVATYSITPERAKKIAFAGPYYSSGAAIQVKADNTSIKTVKDLAGKTVATESNSTGITAINNNVTGANIVLFPDNASCVAAVVQGRAEAYVLDESILLSNVVQNPQLKVVGTPFTQDPYGIGLNRDDPSAKQFVNAFLTSIYDSGVWGKLWEATVGKYVEGATPTAPELGSVPGS
jgi:glutamate transport system substrate-binding protein